MKDGEKTTTVLWLAAKHFPDGFPKPLRVATALKLDFRKWKLYVVVIVRKAHETFTIREA